MGAILVAGARRSARWRAHSGPRWPPDGFSAPYRLAMAFGTAFWGFLGLLLALRLARQYAGDLWAFLATLAIWWASSLPVYMYFNPSWSHAHSAFAVSLFVFYWHQKRQQPTLRQWFILALITGLMLNVYYANAMLLMILVIEALRGYSLAFRRDSVPGLSLAQLLARHLLFLAVTLVCLIPTFVTRQNRLRKSLLNPGYGSVQNWGLALPPHFLAVLFSSEHGLFSWTPLLLLAIVGLVLFNWREPRVGTPLLGAALAFYVFIACYPDWAGISSFGNRFFVSLTPLFVLGLSVLLERTGLRYSVPKGRRWPTASIVLAVFHAVERGIHVSMGRAHLTSAAGTNLLATK